MKTRLTQELRSRLIELAGKVVRCQKEEDALEAAYNKALPLVLAIVHKKFPKKDMKVLEKYNVASTTTVCKLQLTAGGIEGFTFRTEDVPLTASRYGEIYVADTIVTDAIQEWIKTKTAFDKSKGAKVADYRALVNTARNLEEIEEIWPDATNVRPFAHSKALTVLTADVIGRIKADVDARKSVDG